MEGSTELLKTKMGLKFLLMPAAPSSYFSPAVSLLFPAGRHVNTAFSSPCHMQAWLTLSIVYS
jgi:hypothetical protein